MQIRNNVNITIKAKIIELSGGKIIERNRLDRFDLYYAPSGFISVPSGGKGGDLNITTDTLRVLNGAVIVTQTFTEGNAGNLNINADTIEIIGKSPINFQPSGLFSFANLSPPNFNGSGNGGDINIATKQLKILDGATIASSNLNSDISFGFSAIFGTPIELRPGLGRTGNIAIKAEEVFLNRGSITATGNIRGGGEISIDSSNFLRLKNGSEISTDIGESRDFPGGNINITTPLIIANPDSNQISATAITSRGGNININTNVLLGYPQFLTIDASSSFDLDGRINIEGLSDEIRKGVLLTPTPIIDAEAILANDICAVKDGEVAGGSSFTIPGKGGITPNPLEGFEHSRGIVEWSNRPEGETKIRKNNNTSAKNSQKPKRLQPAVGWYRKTDGTVVLTADPAKVRPLNMPIDYPSGCPM